MKCSSPEDWGLEFLVSNISLLETIVLTVAYQFIFRTTCPGHFSYLSCDKVYSNEVLFPLPVYSKHYGVCHPKLLGSD